MLACKCSTVDLSSEQFATCSYIPRVQRYSYSSGDVLVHCWDSSTRILGVSKVHGCGRAEAPPASRLPGGSQRILPASVKEIAVQAGTNIL
jgi:hypothetical protein